MPKRWLFIAAAILVIGGGSYLTGVFDRRCLAGMNPDYHIPAHQITDSKRQPISQKLNHLAGSLSPYLLQHADNPVDWYPWGEEAFQRAVTEDKPIFLSIGYAACHWCHVMEHESFEDSAIANYLNEHFISIKVDREELPEVDEIYMNAVQMMTGSGGWPLTVFLTPDLHPFYGGTYFPPEERYGRPGFRQLLEAIVAVWQQQRDRIVAGRKQMIEGLEWFNSKPGGDADWGLAQADRVARLNLDAYDPANGGFGGAPKFFHTEKLDHFLRVYHRTGNVDYLKAVEQTLTKMARGGIYDQIGGGFHRYSTDAEWFEPHYEKMLYDNALLAPLYADLYLITGNQFYAAIARNTLDWALREMQLKDGGFASSLDADSEGGEGRFYLWKSGEIGEILGEENSRIFGSVFGVTVEGNLADGLNLLHISQPIEMASEKFNVLPEELRHRLNDMRNILLKARNGRSHPARDDKVLVDWNGLIIAALARCSRALGEPRYLAAAQLAAAFIQREMYRNGTLNHAWRNGNLSGSGLLDDYAYLMRGLIELYQADGDEGWIYWSEDLAESLAKRFAHPSGGWYLTTSDRTDLIHRTYNARDGALPSGNAWAIIALWDLWRLTGGERYNDWAVQALNAFSSQFTANPTAHTSLAICAEMINHPGYQAAVVGSAEDVSGFQDFTTLLDTTYTPGLVVAKIMPGSQSRLGLMEGRTAVAGKSTVYLCRDFVCELPITNADELRKSLDQH